VEKEVDNVSSNVSYRPHVGEKSGSNCVMTEPEYLMIRTPPRLLLEDTLDSFLNYFNVPNCYFPSGNEFPV